MSHIFHSYVFMASRALTYLQLHYQELIQILMLNVMYEVVTHRVYSEVQFVLHTHSEDFGMEQVLFKKEI